MTITSLLALFFLLLGLLMIIRTQVVYSVRIKALNVAKDKSQALRQQDRNMDTLIPFKELDKFGTYDIMMLQIWKWKYSQFYPDWNTQ